MRQRAGPCCLSRYRIACTVPRHRRRGRGGAERAIPIRSACELREQFASSFSQELAGEFGLAVGDGADTRRVVPGARRDQPLDAVSLMVIPRRSNNSSRPPRPLRAAMATIAAVWMSLLATSGCAARIASACSGSYAVSPRDAQWLLLL